MIIQSLLNSIISLILPDATQGTTFLGIGQLQQWIFANVELLPLIPAVIIVGGLIILTLSYVSWRKYKGQSQKIKQKDDNLVD
ncbi:sporulation protein YpjB [Oceanobacillus sp. FSL H7-0719]|uniref:sporulation protein YpjB n=1 Tax=Oceanobacillus sp. FSL H7-0719 TaxID=2954507 RepID=UPI003255064F